MAETPVPKSQVPGLRCGMAKLCHFRITIPVHRVPIGAAPLVVGGTVAPVLGVAAGLKPQFLSSLVPLLLPTTTSVTSTGDQGGDQGYPRAHRPPQGATFMVPANSGGVPEDATRGQTRGTNHMDRLCLPWHFATGLGMPIPSKGNHDDRGPNGRPGLRGFARPSPVDVCLIQLTYEILAAETSCARCGAALGRGLRAVPPDVFYLQAWRLLPVTKCTGWRRHAYVAAARESSKDPLFGPFHPNLSHVR